MGIEGVESEGESGRIMINLSGRVEKFTNSGTD